MTLDREQLEQLQEIRDDALIGIAAQLADIVTACGLTRADFDRYYADARRQADEVLELVIRRAEGRLH